MDNSQNQVIESYKDFWKRFVDINGRSDRPDFWHPFWINFVITSLLGIVSAGFLSGLFALAIIIPTFTVMVRRLHDSNRTMLLAIVYHISGVIAGLFVAIFIVTFVFASNSGSGTLIGLALITGPIFMIIGVVIMLYTLYLLVAPGNREPNNYGSGGSTQIAPQPQVNVE
ncbi:MULTISPECIES: DUF805 domain-containing protein [Mammaliicoccus]|uniref:DUF805 domain-containing protein n=1 Tax=Mammaliicoccus vitulinus TaxID=71237 RepID=A0ABX7HIA1_9STAP|nr:MULTISPECIES: DUF805 domain-containing protein [Mammaliicoccus]HAL09534.1 DUF805 domain-containing protein [Staphylococcus sp.]MBM6629258.1 DUF805 domain-containing protein [Mammaliicoccus vitulinus]MBO3077480.1 DUF805 domain-containing protein [Mammaliicoccus vitulinus]MBW0765352.1 DUF805 domain-containing protein [Mammaliicoccus fleurettii]MEB7657966.1 DUF805 domain-containing protein [Mammaliicoccus vitulinus]